MSTTLTQDSRLLALPDELLLKITELAGLPYHSGTSSQDLTKGDLRLSARSDLRVVNERLRRMVDDIEQRPGKGSRYSDLVLVTRNVTNLLSYTLGPRPQRDELLGDLYEDNFYRYNGRSIGPEQFGDQLTPFRMSRNNLVQDLRLHRSQSRNYYYSLSSAKMLQTIHYWMKLDSRVLSSLKSIVINPSNVPFLSKRPYHDVHESLFKVKESITKGNSFSLELLPSAMGIAAEKPGVEVCCTMDLQDSMATMPLNHLPTRLVVHADWCSLPDFQLTQLELEHPTTRHELPEIIYYMSCSGPLDQADMEYNLSICQRNFAKLLRARSAHMTVYTKMYHGGDGFDGDWRITPERFAELTQSLQGSVQAKIDKSGSGSTITVRPDGTAHIPDCKHCGETFLDYQEYAKA